MRGESRTRFGTGWTTRRYTFHQYITYQQEGIWESLHFASTYYGWLRAELTDILSDAGFLGVRWLEPQESGFFQPMVLAHIA